MQAKFKPRPHLIQEGKTDDELFDIFLGLCEQNLAIETSRKYTRVMQNFQQFLKDHNLKIIDYRSETGDVWLAQWDEKPVAKHQYAVLLQRFLDFLGILDPRNGVHIDIPIPRKNRIEEVRRQLISEEDLKAFLQACGSDYRAALLASIMWESTLRASEVASLKWKHVKVEAQLIEVPARKGGMMDSVPYGLYTQTYLRLLNFSGRDPEEPLIESRTNARRGQPMDGKGVYYLVKVYGERAGWRPEQCHPHAFRHSCATNLIRKGMPLASVMEIMNHRQISTTMIYTHLAKEDVLTDYRRVMRPDWKPPTEDEPAKPEICPNCSMQRLPGYVVCPACGHEYVKKIDEEKLHKLLEVLTPESLQDMIVQAIQQFIITTKGEKAEFELSEDFFEAFK